MSKAALRTLVAVTAGGAAVFAATQGLSSASASVQPRTTDQGIAVYQGKVVNRDIVLGPQSAPTQVDETVALPGGTYLVTSTVSAVISSHDQIVCATYPGNVHGNDGVFGTAGNPGTGGVYGTATMTDTLKVAAGQRITISCNSFNYGLGTYASSAVIEAVPAASVTGH